MIFLNDDTIIESELLLKVAKSESDVTGVAQKFSPKSSIIYGLGAKFTDNKLSARFHAKTVEDIFLPSGYFFGIKKRKWIQIKGFNEYFINGGEDVDLFLRCIESGYTFKFLEDPGLHFHSQSLGRNDRDTYNRTLVEYLWHGDRIRSLIESQPLIVTSDGKIKWVSSSFSRPSAKNDSNGSSDIFPPYSGNSKSKTNYISTYSENSPLVSIIVPCRIGENLLSLESIANQSHKNIQLIVEYDSLNEGASVVRNRGKEKAKGDYLFFCDNDIILNPEIISIMVNELQRDRSKAWVFGKYYIDGKLRNRNKSTEVPPIGSEEWVSYFSGVSTMSLIRASANPTFNPEVKKYNDWDLWLTLEKKNLRGKFIDETIFITRNRPGGISSIKGEEKEYWLNRIYHQHQFAFQDSPKSH